MWLERQTIMTTPAIVAEGLTYAYGDLTAVDHISFTVAPGEVLGFLGPNGAGKSTTVKILTGQLRPKSGRAELLGIDVSKHPNRVQSEIGVGLGDRKRDRVAGFSKGMRQRLMIARALVNSPRILFLDEPTDGLDPVSAESIRGIIREQSQGGTTVFLTTHDMVEADKLSHRVAFIEGGKIVAQDTPHNLKQQYGKRALRAEVLGSNGALEVREIVLDGKETADAVQRLFATEEVVTVHSEEATLEDIFIKITGRGLA
jgi:ABC-2 type transport system ATP-binding protein